MFTVMNIIPPCSDVDDGFKNTKQIFEELGLERTTEEDCRIVQHVCCLVSTRAAYLASAGLCILLIQKTVKKKKKKKKTASNSEI